MFGALILVAVKGTIDLKEGGVDVVLSEAYRTSRIESPMFVLFYFETLFGNSIFL